ncbi:MAG: hypothetical protein E5Y73_11880 [Mesorhizobium sp.]|uniref:hypothetical protein n=1 Tax=Mesorhizobium sp. TaxID=1871066 RepID=UPI0012057592|nr:hypothetical protein [Mesorhizobium sp.]TIL94416.1 MAG: hypothetical protein E5Y73_11880 [Mesorhizobium sp.]
MALKNKWPPGHSVAATFHFSRARVRTGRCQRAHHQTVLIERMFMAIPIAAIARPRNWIPMEGMEKA